MKQNKKIINTLAALLAGDIVETKNGERYVLADDEHTIAVVGRKLSNGEQTLLGYYSIWPLIELAENATDECLVISAMNRTIRKSTRRRQTFHGATTKNSIS